LFGIIGRKARVGGLLSLMWKPRAQPGKCIGYWQTWIRERVVEFLV